MGDVALRRRQVTPRASSRAPHPGSQHKAHLLSTVGDALFDGPFLPHSTFRFGALRALLRTDNAEFRDRFHRIFHDCLEMPGERAPASTVELRVSSAHQRHPVRAEISPHAARDAASVMGRIFPELELVRVDGESTPGWELAARRADPLSPILAARGESLVIDRAAPWQIMVAHYFLDHVMSLQPHLAFFHAATVAVGNRGVLIGGPKGAGKSTLSLALAARGHGFLGDEIAAIDRETRQITPFRRAVSIRTGPQAAEVSEYLGRNTLERETLADGSERVRAPVSNMFPRAAGRHVRLTHAIFLQPLARRPSAAAFEFSMADMPLVSPLRATLGGSGHGGHVVAFLGIFRAVRCFRVAPGGTPDETAGLIEGIVE